MKISNRPVNTLYSDPNSFYPTEYIQFQTQIAMVSAGPKE